ncbi:MAG: TerB family tellurite resistance protein [Gemmatimonadetes bacterium]|nr:TerB family tellurite resistance protein [Gemmatimonadota bacterium]
MAPLLQSQWRFRPVGGGTFHCPRCDRERDYTGTGVRTYLALFGRPLFPTRAEQTLVACDECGAIYDVEITTMDPAAARDVRSEDELALEAVLAGVVFSDSAVRPVEKRVARDAVRHYTHRPETGGGERLTVKRRNPADPFERIARLAGILDESSRRRFVAAAYRVCGADRELHSQEARLLMQLGEVLNLGPREIREAMREGMGGES